MFNKKVKKISLYTLASILAVHITQQSTHALTDQPILPIQAKKSLSWEDSVYFNTKMLLQDEITKTHLKEDGFEEQFFKTPDNFNINSLFLENKNAQFNVICCAGWLPGKKEGMAPFFKLLPENCNVLFFDARGHGKSEGSLLISTLQYGKYEYFDIIGAVQYIHKKNNKPIIILGTCSGAFHAAHAIIKMTEQQEIEKYNVRAFIFDSGWGSPTSVSLTVPKAGVDEYFINMLKKRYPDDNKITLRQKLLFKIGSPIINFNIKLLHTIVAQWPFVWYEKETNLFDKMYKIQIPTFFVHSLDDTYAPFEDAKKLAAQVSCKTCWWIDKPSKHACHSLKHKKQYKKQLTLFLNSALQSK